MRLLAFLTEFFINAFQVTRPPPDQKRRVELIIGGLTLAFLLLAAGLIAGMLVWAVRV